MCFGKIFCCFQYFFNYPLLPFVDGIGCDIHNGSNRVSWKTGKEETHLLIIFLFGKCQFIPQMKHDIVHVIIHFLFQNSIGFRIFGIFINKHYQHLINGSCSCFFIVIVTIINTIYFFNCLKICTTRQQILSPLMLFVFL